MISRQVLHLIITGHLSWTPSPKWRTQKSNSLVANSTVNLNQSRRAWNSQESSQENGRMRAVLLIFQLANTRLLQVGTMSQVILPKARRIKCSRKKEWFTHLNHPLRIVRSATTKESSRLDTLRSWKWSPNTRTRQQVLAGSVVP